MDYITSIEVLINKYPDRIKNLFGHLDFKHEGLATVEEHVSEGNLVMACNELLAYYSRANPMILYYFQKRIGSKQETSTADEILENHFTIQLVKDQVPCSERDGLDWHHLGPHQDKEWGWGVNRHGSLRRLLQEWKETGSEACIRKANELVQDWIISNPVPEIYTPSAPWRALETCLRLTYVWGRLFYEFPTNELFLPSTKIMMLSSIWEQTDHVLQNHVPSGNILIMNLVSLLVTSAYFPEFKNAIPTVVDYSTNTAWKETSISNAMKIDNWVDYALPHLLKEIVDVQVYPDGVQKELTQHYHGVVVRNAEIILAACDALYVIVPPEFTKKVQDMWSYLAWITRPNGKSLNNNDSDLDDWKEHLLAKAREHGRADWTYIVTRGEEGARPRAEITGGISKNDLSILFPWAGQAIMRGSWKKDASWLFFDIGPFGTGHQHHDKLHVSADAFGHHWLVDSGRYWYKGGIWRENYFKNTRGHNTIMFSRMGQQEFDREAKKPVGKQFISTDEFDCAIGKYNEGYGLTWQTITSIPNFDELYEPMLEKLDESGSLEVADGLSLKRPLSHARAVCFLRDEGCWLVVDRIETGHPQMAQVLWHFHPECEVNIENTNVVVASRPDGTRFVIKPITTEKIHLILQEGVGEPLPQGWWSREYNHKEPSPCAIYSLDVEHSTQLGWLLVPIQSHDNVPAVKQLPSSGEREVTYEINRKVIITVSTDVDHPSCKKTR